MKRGENDLGLPPATDHRLLLPEFPSDRCARDLQTRIDRLAMLGETQYIEETIDPGVYDY
jgi:hypothetical protein